MVDVMVKAVSVCQVMVEAVYHPFLLLSATSAFYGRWLPVFVISCSPSYHHKLTTTIFAVLLIILCSLAFVTHFSSASRASAIVCHCLALSVIACHCLLLPAIACHCLSLPAIASLALPDPCWISKWIPTWPFSDAKCQMSSVKWVWLVCGATAGL